MNDDADALNPDRLFETFAPFSGLLLAVSGGPDSMALLRLAAAWRDAAATAPSLAAATVDHGLRPEAAAEAEKVAEWSRSLGIPHKTLVWRGEKPTTALQEKARNARYDLLFQFMRDINATALATAHHADDQWETVMIRLARGSGISGLAGISPDHDGLGGRLIRPLLHVSKSALIDYCRLCGQDFFDDPSNADPRFARSAWRELSSPLHRLGLTRERMATLSERAEKYERGLDWAAKRLFSDVEISSDENIYDLSGAEDAPQAVVEHFLQSALAKALGCRALRLERLEKLAGKLGCALRAGDQLHATIGGCTLALDKSKRLRVRPEPERKRGRR